MGDICKQAHAIKLRGKISPKPIVAVKVIAISTLSIYGAAGGGIDRVLTARIPNRVGFKFTRGICNNPV